MPSATIDTVVNTSLVAPSTKQLEQQPHNQAFVLLAKNQFAYETRPIPELPSEKHVIVAIKATGLCGSDVRTHHY